MMVAIPAFLPALPEIFLAVAGMALLMLGVFRGDGSTRMVGQLTVLAFACAAALVLVGGGERAVTFNGLFVVDGFAAFSKLLVLGGSAMAVLMAQGFIEREQMGRFEFPVLILFATIGMLLMISANDLISLYVGLEAQSLALYVLAAIRRDAGRSTEAGLKYFVLGALSSGLLLYGASLVYGYAGTTGFDGIAGLLKAGGGAPVGVVIGLVFVLAGLAFKISAVPFHMWTPDVYEGAPTPVTALFAIAPKMAAIALVTRVLVGPFLPLIGQWQQVVMLLSVASMVLGALAAIHQTNIKRLMAYSSIGHVGFALLGLAAGTAEGVQAVMVYMAIYLFMSAGAFAVILCMRQQGRMVEGIGQLAGLGRTHPLMALAMGIFMFSMAGIPPLAGFFGKFYVFLAAVHVGATDPRFYWLAVIGVLASVVGAFYYLRIVKLMYFDEPKEVFDRQADDSLAAVLTGTGVVTMFFFLYPAPILNGAAMAAAALFPG